MLYGMVPQPGQYWVVRIRPVEYDCPRCHVPLDVGANGNNDTIVRIVSPSQVPNVTLGMRHKRRGCGGSIPVPEGWVWYWDGSWYYALPYTLFEPLRPGPNAIGRKVPRRRGQKE